MHCFVIFYIFTEVLEVLKVPELEVSEDIQKKNVEEMLEVSEVSEDIQKKNIEEMLEVSEDVHIKIIML